MAMEARGRGVRQSLRTTWVGKARANLFSDRKADPAARPCSPTSSLRLEAAQLGAEATELSPSGRGHEQLKQPSGDKRTVGIKSDLIKWLRTWVASGLGRWHAEAQQMKGAGGGRE